LRESFDDATSTSLETHELWTTDGTGRAVLSYQVPAGVTDGNRPIGYVAEVGCVQRGS